MTNETQPTQTKANKNDKDLLMLAGMLFGPVILICGASLCIELRDRNHPQQGFYAEKRAKIVMERLGENSQRYQSYLIIDKTNYYALVEKDNKPKLIPVRIQPETKKKAILLEEKIEN